MPCPVAATVPSVLNGTALPQTCWRRAANQTWAHLVPAATHAAEETLTSPSTKGCPTLRRSALARNSSRPGNMELGRVMPSMIVSATAKCLSLIIFVQSAQLDQYAATLALTADVSPSPPMERGKLAVIFAVQVPVVFQGWRANTPTRLHRDVLRTGVFVLE